LNGALPYFGYTQVQEAKFLNRDNSQAYWTTKGIATIARCDQ